MAALGCQEQRPQLHGKVLFLDSLPFELPKARD